MRTEANRIWKKIYFTKKHSCFIMKYVEVTVLIVRYYAGVGGRTCAAFRMTAQHEGLNGKEINMKNTVGK